MTNHFKIPVGISACLLGEKVRYDGGSKFHPFINTYLAEHLDLISFCPEVGAGLGIPRPPIELVQQPMGLGVVQVDNPAIDVTESLINYSHQQRLKLSDLFGFIFKARSPSCGVGSTPVSGFSNSSQLGSGVFAGFVQDSFPLMPLVEEGDLASKSSCEAFIENVRSYYCDQQQN